jgi:hypothetical protein
MKLLGIMILGFDITDQLLIRILRSSDTGGKMGVHHDSTSAFCTFKESLRFNLEESSVKYFGRV